VKKCGGHLLFAVFQCYTGFLISCNHSQLKSIFIITNPFRKEIMKALLTILSLAILMAAQSQTYMYVEDVLITPESPALTTDEMSIQVLGNFSNPGAFLMDHSVTVDGFTVQLELNADHDGGIHTDVLVPFDTTIVLGMFEPGEYHVDLSGTYMGDFVSDTSKFNFVIEEAETDGVIENEGVPRVQIYPNPTADLLTVNYYNWQVNSQIQLIAMDSKVVLTTQIASESTEMNLSSFENGAYLIRIFDAKGAVIRTEQIIIGK
jgi:hypothetical protein